MFDLERCALVGMVHCLALPGSPGWGGDMKAVLARAESDATALLAGGCDAILVENMGDLPFLRGHVAPETTAAMAVVAHRLAALGAPIGIQLLAAANREALGVAVAAGAQFIRVEGFAYGHLADEGWIDACAGPLLRTKATLKTPIEIWADVQKKHAAHAMTADLGLAELAKGATFCGADVVILSGKATGSPTSSEDVEAASATGCPVAVGSGVTPENAALLSAISDALIVGSFLKVDGHWKNPVDSSRVTAIRKTMI